MLKKQSATYYTTTKRLMLIEFNRAYKTYIQQYTDLYKLN